MYMIIISLCIIIIVILTIIIVVITLFIVICLLSYSKDPNIQSDLMSFDVIKKYIIISKTFYQMNCRSKTIQQ